MRTGLKLIKVPAMHHVMRNGICYTWSHEPVQQKRRSQWPLTLQKHVESALGRYRIASLRSNTTL